MPRHKFRSKYGKVNKNKGRQFDRKKLPKKVEAQGSLDRTSKKYKFIRRNQENEEALRKQQQLEQNYKEKNAGSNAIFEADDLEYSSEDEKDDQKDSLVQLMSTFKNPNGESSRMDDAIESEDDSASEEEKGELDNEHGREDSESGDDTFPETFEEQSQPRGRKYHSSEEEEDGESEDSPESNGIEMDESVHNLRPEEFENNGHFDDIFEGEENSEPESEIDEDNDQNTQENGTDDKFDVHFEHDLHPSMLECMTSCPSNSVRKENCCWPTIGRIQIEIPTVNESESSDGVETKKREKLTLLDDETSYAMEGTVPIIYDSKSFSMEKAAIKSQLRPHVIPANECNIKTGDEPFTNLQCELFSVMNNYQDLFYNQRNHSNGGEIRFMYTLHALNHIMKTRTKVMNHNSKLKTMGLTDSKSVAIIPDQYRDQGLFRSKVLIVVPFRQCALDIVNILISLLFPGGENSTQVMHYKRFIDEYGGQTLHFPKKNPKPEDYELTFAGNSDDTFRIGIALTRKCLKLYSDFYSSDILLVSPLGLRMIIGAPGDKDRDYDFLASIEVLILDQADIFLAQNWDHLLHILDHLHLQPQSARNTDFSRVRSWCLNGWSRFYRQTLLFTSHELPEFRSLFNSRCSNYRGKVRSSNPIESGSIKHVTVQIPQTFHRIDVTSIQSSFDQRSDYFINTILPQFKAASKAHCLILMPSYFDFVRVRNYFKKETLSFTQICEYTKDAKIDRSRSMFFHSGAHFMLYSERAHFFRRTRLKGIRHLIMYQPPTWPHFYSEMINLMQSGNQNPRDGIAENMMSVTVLYTKYDLLQIAAIVGSAQANTMSRSTKSTHVFTTTE